MLPPSFYAIYDIYAIYGEFWGTANHCRTRLPKNGHQKSTNIHQKSTNIHQKSANIHQKKYQYNFKKVPIDNGPIFSNQTNSCLVIANRGFLYFCILGFVPRLFLSAGE